MSDHLSPEARKVINARASDAVAAIFRAVEAGSRRDLEHAARELVEVLDDEQAAQAEWSV